MFIDMTSPPRVDLDDLPLGHVEINAQEGTELPIFYSVALSGTSHRYINPVTGGITAIIPNVDAPISAKPIIHFADGLETNIPVDVNTVDSLKEVHKDTILLEVNKNEGKSNVLVYKNVGGTWAESYPAGGATHQSWTTTSEMYGDPLLVGGCSIVQNETGKQLSMVFFSQSMDPLIKIITGEVLDGVEEATCTMGVMSVPTTGEKFYMMIAFDSATGKILDAFSMWPIIQPTKNVQSLTELSLSLTSVLADLPMIPCARAIGDPSNPSRMYLFSETIDDISEPKIVKLELTTSGFSWEEVNLPASGEEITFLSGFSAINSDITIESDRNVFFTNVGNPTVVLSALVKDNVGKYYNRFVFRDNLTGWFSSIDIELTDFVGHIGREFSNVQVISDDGVVKVVQSPDGKLVLASGGRIRFVEPSMVVTSDILDKIVPYKTFIPLTLKDYSGLSDVNITMLQAQDEVLLGIQAEFIAVNKAMHQSESDIVQFESGGYGNGTPGSEGNDVLEEMKLSFEDKRVTLRMLLNRFSAEISKLNEIKGRSYLAKLLHEGTPENILDEARAFLVNTFNIPADRLPMGFEMIVQHFMGLGFDRAGAVEQARVNNGLTGRDATNGVYA